MKIFFIGCVEFSKNTLKKVIELNGNIVGVATKSRSKFNSDHSDLAPICVEQGITYKHVKDINAEHIVDWINSLRPDIIFVFGWSSLIKRELLEIAPMGVLGFHPAKLPANRGRHPIIWALVLGLRETGSTFFFMDEGADSGDILSQELIDIEEKDDARVVYNKVMKTALSQIESFVPLLKDNNYNLISQKKSKTNYWRRRNRLDGQIDFRMTSKAIYDLVRALTKPYVGAHIFYNDEDIKIWKVEITNCDKINLEPGKILGVNSNIIKVKTFDGAINIVNHEFEILPKINDYL
jgi:methionyl-tRNA formyltransferase